MGGLSVVPPQHRMAEWSLASRQLSNWLPSWTGCHWQTYSSSLQSLLGFWTRWCLDQRKSRWSGQTWLNNSFYRIQTRFATPLMLHCESSMAVGCSGSCQSLGHGAYGPVHTLPPACHRQEVIQQLACSQLSCNKSITRVLTLHNGLNDHMCRIGWQLITLYSRCKEGP